MWSSAITILNGFFMVQSPSDENFILGRHEKIHDPDLEYRVLTPFTILKLRRKVGACYGEQKNHNFPVERRIDVREGMRFV